MSTNTIPTYWFNLPVALLFGIFFSKLYDYLNKYDKIKSLCGDTYKRNQFKVSNIDDIEREREESCYDNKRKLEDNYDDKKLVYMLVVGLAGIILGAVLINRRSAIGVGVGMGGMLTMVYFLFSNWTRINSLYQIVSIGAILASLMYGSSIYSNK